MIVAQLFSLRLLLLHDSAAVFGSGRHSSVFGKSLGAHRIGKYRLAAGISLRER